MHIRTEAAEDADTIGEVTRVAFAGAEHSDGTEQEVVAALREKGALAESLVAKSGGEIVGHVAASRVHLAPEAPGEWFGIGPLSVRPDMQRQGIGAALMAAVLDRLEERGARGAVLLGDPDYYRRFGFQPAAPMRFPDAPAEYFQAKFLGTGEGEGRGFPASDVIYDKAFGAGSGEREAGLAERTSAVSWRSPFSVLSAGSMFSAASVLSLGSAGSILSIGSAGSILSIGSSGSILSIGSAGSILSIGGAGTVRNRRRGNGCGTRGSHR